MRIVLGVTGGIAAYKAADLCSQLIAEGAQVRVAMTPCAQQFVGHLTFEALTQHPVYTDVIRGPEAYLMEHITWSQWGEVLVIAPATAGTLARMAAGLADDPVSSLYISFTGPVVVAPAMNTRMLNHPATQANLQTLRSRGVEIIEPEEGRLACGETGPGRLAAVDRIRARVLDFMYSTAADSAGDDGRVPAPAANATQAFEVVRSGDQSLAGKVVVVTSGPTHEYIDPVRFLTNPSSGRMGSAIAAEAARRGATVHLVTGPVAASVLPRGDGLFVHKVTTAEQMLARVRHYRGQTDLFVFAAAVGDFRAAHAAGQKMKRTGNSVNLQFVENPDIAQLIGLEKQPGQVTVGFAAETENLEVHALGKLERKRLDAIVANDVADPRIGFESESNEVTVYLADGSKVPISRRAKTDVARELVDVLVRSFPALRLPREAEHMQPAP